MRQADLITETERLKALGMERAKRRRAALIARAQVALLDAIANSVEGCATIDDATDDLTESFGSGGHWRGSVTRALAMEGAIRRAGMTLSKRPSRHRGYLSSWKKGDPSIFESRRRALRLVVEALDFAAGIENEGDERCPTREPSSPTF